MIKTRIFPKYNYKAIHLNGKTLRIALDPNRPIGELEYPEFYDVKLTSFCNGNCPWCYQDSTPHTKHDNNIIEKFLFFFKDLSENEKPFQIAFGGGEPTTHPKFLELLIECFNLGIVPNYTTNGMWTSSSEDVINSILSVTKEYCGGVAVSTHPHLKEYWERAVELYLEKEIFTNLHVIIGDKESIDDFVKIYNKYKGLVKYFVLLPLTAQGRAKKAHVEWDYFQKNIEGSPGDIAFGANFYPHLMEDPSRFKVSLYEPEILSKYLDLETMNVYNSSFSIDPIYQKKYE